MHCYWVLTCTASPKRQPHGFTLIELLVAVIIIAAIAGIALPRYSKTVAEGTERDALIQLLAIRQSNEFYKSRNGTFWPSSGTQAEAAIEATLMMTLNSPNISYTCSGDGLSFTCTATPDGGGYTVNVTESPLSEVPGSLNPCCGSGTCPTLKAC